MHGEMVLTDLRNSGMKERERLLLVVSTDDDERLDVDDNVLH